MYALSSMTNILSSAKKEALVSSFLEIAVDQSAKTALHFLQATNWRIEGALQLFYVGDARQSVASSSHARPVGGLEQYPCNVNAREDDGVDSCPPRPVTTVAPTALLSGSAGVLIACASTTACRKRRTRAEIDAATQSSLGDLLLHGIAQPAPAIRQRTRLRAEMAATPLSYKDDLVCAGPGLVTTIPRQQPPAQEQSPHQIGPLPSPNDVVGSSRRTRARSTDSTCSRQSKRVRDLQQNDPYTEHSLPHPRPMVPSHDVVIPSRHVKSTSTSFTYS